MSQRQASASARLRSGGSSVNDDAGRLSLTYFADLLEYPRGDIIRVAEECAALLSPALPEAAGPLRDFANGMTGLPRGTIEEIYTSTFDLDPVCYLYVGYHVFGETYKRSVFLVALKERYRNCGVGIDSELADHISAMLRYVVAGDDAEDVDVVVREALLPALQRMTGRAKSAGHDDEGESPPVETPAGERQLYRGLLEALRLVLMEMAGIEDESEIELAALAHRSLAH
ncbi:MAG TPA: hypothetical protein DCX80_07515 [Chloroflexi bacterium]|nr:hypothetical protein [Chloroflexota bacterium]